MSLCALLRLWGLGLKKKEKKEKKREKIRKKSLKLKRVAVKSYMFMRVQIIGNKDWRHPQFLELF